MFLSHNWSEMSVQTSSSETASTVNSTEAAILTAGSRSVTDDYQADLKTFAKLAYLADISQHDISTVVHGDNGNSPDHWGKEYAQQVDGISENPFPAQWNDIDHPDAVVAEGQYGKYDKAAGYRRNESMAQFLSDFDGQTCAFLFWDGESSGTNHMRELCIEYDIPMIIVICGHPHDSDSFKSLKESYEQDDEPPVMVVSMDRL